MNLKKLKTKQPVCEKCGMKMAGRVPIETKGVLCFMCYNPNEGEQDEDTNWKDKRE